MALVTDDTFWGTIEGAWAHAEGRWDGVTKRPLREAILVGDHTKAHEAFEAFLPSLERELRLHYSEKRLFEFLELFRTKVAALDCEALALHVGADAEEFVAARHFIVALGQSYFESVTERPETALVGCALEWLEQELRFRVRALVRSPLPPSRVNVASGTNVARWPSLQTRELVEARTTAVAEALWRQLGFEGDASTGPLDVPPATAAEREGAVLRLGARIRTRRAKARAVA